MKTVRIKTLAFSFAVATAVLITGCKEEIQPEPQLNSSGSGRTGDLAILQFDGAKFGKAIETYMNGRVAGYGYTVFHDGQLVAGNGGGWARKPFESTPTKHSDQQRQGIASCSKFVTALATVALLEKHRISLSTPVYFYLPVSWKPSDDFKKITFERLLAHQTGLTNYNNGWDGFKKAVEELDVDNKVRKYDNVNYSLMAVILAYVDIKMNQSYTTQQLLALEANPAIWYSPGNLGFRFRSLVRVLVFKPAGLLYWNIVDYTTWNNNGVISPELGTKGYPSVNGNEPGTLKGDLRINGGSGGLYISANEFGRIQDAAAHGQIVSAVNYEAMKTKFLGFDGVVNGARGKYYWKNGGANNHEAILFDTGRTQICVFANSTHSAISNDRSIIANAYDNAWVVK